MSAIEKGVNAAPFTGGLSKHTEGDIHDAIYTRTPEDVQGVC